MDKFTTTYVLVVSLAYLAWSSFKIKKAFGKRAAVYWAVSITVWFVLIPIVLIIILKLLSKS